jgi:hypothetical protein
MFLLFLGGAARAQEPSAQQPSATPAPAAATQSAEPQAALPRESPVENAIGRTDATSGNTFGGYGELTYNDPSNGPGVVDLRRFVLYFGHDFSERLRFYSEVEVEHAVSSAGDQGEVEIEQAYLDGLLHKKLNLRGGLILMPVGIINIYHEPPSFNGVDRPDVDQFVIPTTWREAGAGIFGEIAEGLRYQLYGVTGFNSNGFTAGSAIREGHQEAQLAYAGDFGGVARLDYEPVLGTVFGFSAYGATSGNKLRSSVGRVPVAMFEADARTRWQGFTARAEVAALFVGDAGPLNQALVAEGSPEQQEALPISSKALGGYLEVGYDLLHLLAPGERQSLTAFTRAEYVDTQADVPAGFDARLEFRRYSGVAGLVYRPIPQVALKADYRRREFGTGPGYNEIATAITWLF